MQPIAVAFVHGIEIADPDFAATPSRLLREGFAKAIGPGGPDPDEALVIEPVLWAPHLQERQLQLFDRMYPDSSRAGIVEVLMAGVKKVNAGSQLALLALAPAAITPWLPGLNALRYPGLRWVMVHFVGDVIAYDRGPSPQNYAAVHAVLAQGLARLSRRAGENAPLCIVGHSFGTVLSSDYIYDQQVSVTGEHDLVPAEVRAEIGTSPLAHGDTLTWFYTLGSPLALWSLRYPDGEFSRPISVPGIGVSEHHPGLRGEWINVYSKQDIFAYPLRPLGREYARAVTADQNVRLGTWPLSLTPLVHPYFWSNRALMDCIGASLARGWQTVNTPIRSQHTPKRGRPRGNRAHRGGLALVPPVDAAT
ncbi:MAG: hypothetical protein IPI32_01340 [Austwickia sp.]|nr:hypothetical protein [Austwickia sp.]MBK9102870.1 hypothetical protein [Austwickia sp.]